MQARAPTTAPATASADWYKTCLTPTRLYPIRCGTPTGSKCACATAATAAQTAASDCALGVTTR